MANGKKNGKIKRIVKPKTKGIRKGTHNSTRMPMDPKATTKVVIRKPKTNTQKLREAKKTLKSVKTNRKLEKKVLKSERAAGINLSRINERIRKQTNRRVRTARRLK